MKKSTIHSAIRIFAIVLGITVASQASARYFHNPSAKVQYRIVKIEAPAAGLSVFGTFNTAGPEMGMLRIPMMPSAMTAKTGLFDGGNEGDDTTSGNDTTADNDTSDHGPHDLDTNDHGGHGHHHGHDKDSTDHGTDTTDNGGHGDIDSTGDIGDTTDGGKDSTDLGDTNDHNMNDTVDTGGHHTENDDSTNVHDTTAHNLFNGGHQSIVVRSHGPLLNVIVQFTNNLPTSATITGMSLATGRNFAITGDAPTAMKPTTLAPGATISLKITFNAADYQVHTDQLVVKSSSAQSTSMISLSGVQVAAASVSNSIPAGVTITALPNPMTSRLKVDLRGVNSAAVNIYDISGKTVLSTSITSGEWIWNGTAADGTALVAGTYIVRITGTSTEGAPFISTQKIILAR